MSLVTVPPD